MDNKFKLKLQGQDNNNLEIMKEITNLIITMKGIKTSIIKMVIKDNLEEVDLIIIIMEEIKEKEEKEDNSIMDNSEETLEIIISIGTMTNKEVSIISSNSFKITINKKMMHGEIQKM